MADPFIGEICAFAFNFTPEGWLLCDGSKQPLGTYQALYTIIGDKYGQSDYKTYFTLPDLRGKVPLGAGVTAGNGTYVVGKDYGADTATVNTSQLAAHTHQLQKKKTKGGAVDKTAAPSASSSLGVLTVGTTNVACLTTESPNGLMAQATLGVAGVDAPTAHENRQPYLCMSYYISTSGTYPVRS